MSGRLTAVTAGVNLNLYPILVSMYRKRSTNDAKTMATSTKTMANPMATSFQADGTDAGQWIASDWSY